MKPRLARAQRILVATKFRYLGDTIVATPFLRRLKEALPQADVTHLAGPAIPVLLQGCPYLAGIWTHPADHAGVWGSARLIRQIRNARFDAAFLLNRSLHSALVTALAGVPERIGFRSEGRGPLLTTAVPYDRERPESECFLDLLRAVGIDSPCCPGPKLWVTEEERGGARALVERDGEVRRPLILVQPGARDPYRKQWDSARFGMAISLLTPRTGGTVALIGASEETAVCNAAADAAGAPVHNLAGRTSLRQVMALIAESDLLIANETAMVHVAAALGTPTVAICGPQSVGKWTYGPPHRVVTVPLGRGKFDRHANRRALDTIQPDAVIAAALESLNERRIVR